MFPLSAYLGESGILLMPVDMKSAFGRLFSFILFYFLCSRSRLAGSYTGLSHVAKKGTGKGSGRAKWPGTTPHFPAMPCEESVFL
jgi:hypothetical protein